VTVGLVGTGTVAVAAKLALDVLDGTSAEPIDIDAIDRVERAIVVGPAGDDRFERADRLAREGSTPWVAVERGGIAGHPGCGAAVTPFDPGRGCYHCLSQRVGATDSDDPDGRPTLSPPDAVLVGALAVRELLADTSGPFGRVVEYPWTERTWLPVPTCSTCGTPRDRTLDRSHEAVSLDTALDRAEVAFDDRCGIVNSVGERDSFPAPYYLATLASTAGFSDLEAPDHAAGVDADWNPAFMKALGEALERYCAAIYRHDATTTAPATELDDAVPPEAFVMPDPPAPDTPIDWVPGRRLTDDATVSVPADRVHYPAPDGRFSITTGLGLGASSVAAIIAGLTEVVERDATMCSWYSTHEPPALAIDDAAVRTLAQRARAENLTVTPLLVTQDIDVPVVSVAVHRDGDWPRFAMGSGAALDPAAAARSALSEAIQNWMELRAIGREDARTEASALAEYATFPDRARSLVSPDRTVDAASLAPDPIPEGEAALDTLVQRVSDAGLTPYAARVTTDDVAALGFEAVRATIPAAQPLFIDDAVFGERAETVPAAMGEQPRLDRERHPYP
jgi:ribosomal protein S12 methylthiotransferase accessory factor